MSMERLDWASGLALTAGPYFIGLYQPSPETVGFWDGVKQHELRLKWCPACARAFHPKRIVCTDCGSAELEWRAASGRGKVYSCSEVHHAPGPEFTASLPYWVGLVALEEGVYLFSRLIADPGAVAIDAPARVDFQVLEQGRLMPVFRIGTP
jgi:uncharacterized OB-fold protein